MKKPTTRRPAVSDTKWKTYTTAGAAAAAAGLVGNAQAAITFLDYNDTVVVDPIIGDGVNAGTIANWGLFNVDFNGDAQVDIIVAYRQFSTTSGTANIFPAAGATTSVVGLISSGFNYPSRLGAGVDVGGSAAFIAVNGGLQGGRGDMAWGPGFPSSQWVAPAGGPASTGYLGVKFKIGAADHFGWIRVSVEPDGAGTARRLTMHDAAYESSPGVSILTGDVGVPEPGGVGLLALGGIGLTAMRRRRVAKD